MVQNILCIGVSSPSLGYLYELSMASLCVIGLKLDKILTQKYSDKLIPVQKKCERSLEINCSAN